MKGTVIAICTAGLCVLPAVASASVRTETVSVGQQAVVSATAECPKGQRATGGGWQSTPTVSEDVQVYPMESRKVGQSKWTVTGAQNSPNPYVNASMTAIVYCSKNAPRTTQEKKQLVLPNGPLTNLNAKCGDGKRVQAGGFNAPTNITFVPFTSILENYRTGDSAWRVRAAGSGNADVTSYAYCASRKAPQAREGTPVPAALPTDQHSATSKKCDGTVVAGGFKQTDESTSEDFEAFYGSYRDGSRWEIAGSHYGNNENGLISIAYCD